MIAALYVETNGCYYGLPNVDPWDEHRDARKYQGPHRVIAHPPCARWSVLANVNKARYGTPIGEDGGCFESALKSIRSYGGVLEHPWRSMAFAAYGLTRPKAGAGWIDCGNGEWTCLVSQKNYGHRAVKKTWLYLVGDKPPELDWSIPHSNVWISIDRPLSVARIMGIEMMGKKERLQTPIPFRDLLIGLADGSK